MHDADPASIVERCGEVLAGGEPVIIPTDTVYGLAARVDVPGAVGRIFALKGREAAKALVVMVSALEEALEMAVPDERRTLSGLGRLWPGALTLVVKAAPLPWMKQVAPDSQTLGIRIPDNHFVLELLSACGPLAVTSANPAGGPAPASLREVDPGLLERIELAVDGGECGSGKPSTVAEVSGGELKVLRAGGISEGELAQAMAAEREGEGRKTGGTRG